MDRVNWNWLDGDGIVLDDFIKEQENYRDGFKGVLSSFNESMTAAGSFIISGCVWVPSVSPAVTTGYLCFKGEILKFTGGVAPTPGVGEIIYWDIDSSIDTTGNRLSENGATITPYEVRTAKLIAGVAPLDYLQVIPSVSPKPASVTLQDKIVAQVVDGFPKPVIFKVGRGSTDVEGSGLDDASFGSHFSDISGSTMLRYWKDAFGYVHIQGRFKCDSSTGSSRTIFTLPTGYRPIANDEITVLIIYENNGIVGYADSFLTSINGDVTINLSGVSENFSIPHFSFYVG